MAQKRKLTESKVPEVPELIKSSKLEITEAKKKALTKNEITIKFNTLLLKHEELLKAHQESLQKIDHLEKEIESKRRKREKRLFQMVRKIILMFKLMILKPAMNVSIQQKIFGSWESIFMNTTH